MSEILVTGGAGFIGSQLSYKLIKEGNDVVIIDNMSYGKEDNLIFDDLDLSKYLIKCDIRDTNQLHKIFKQHKFEYVYNIAGIAPLPDCQTNPTEAVDVNVNGFVNILELSRIYGVRTVIQASTNAMYENVNEFPTKESFDKLPTLIYPNTKYCAERFAQSFCDTYGMNVCCVRFANVYGPHVDCLRKQPPFVGYLIRELYYNRVPTFYSNGEQSRDYIYVDDLIELLKLVQTCKGFDVVNCSSNTRYSVKDIYSMAQKIMNNYTNAIYMDSANYWSNYPELYNGSYTIKNSILAHEVNKLTLCDNKHAIDDYNWVPKVSMEEGLKRMIEYQTKLFSNLNNE